MLLVIDVGNTNIVIGLMDGMEVRHTFRISTIARTTDELGVLLLQLCAHRGVAVADVRGCIVSCVVPSVLYTIEKALRNYFHIDAMVVGKGLKTGMRVRTDNPREVGADRIVNGVAAFHRWGGPIVIVDFGTATTFDCVNEQGEWVGGAISPGIKIAEEALFSRTSKLPRVEIERPPAAIGKNTVHAMQSGLFFGYIGLVDALARRCAEELGGAKVVATGGLAALFSEESQTIEEVDPHLTLRGLVLIYERNREGAV